MFMTCDMLRKWLIFDIVFGGHFGKCIFWVSGSGRSGIGTLSYLKKKKKKKKKKGLRYRPKGDFFSVFPGFLAGN